MFLWSWGLSLTAFHNKVRDAILLHPKSSQDFPCSQWLHYGSWTLASSAIPSIPFCSSSCLLCLLIHPQTLFPPAFHVSKLCFVSCFCSTSHFRSPCSIFRSLNPDPDIRLILVTLICPIPIYICSELHVCSSVWNQHWLSLKLIVWTSEPLSKFEDSRHLVAQHISWSQVLAEPPAPRYALGPCLIS